MSDPTAALKAAVGRLMRDAQALEVLFAQNWQNEANRPKLQSGFELEGAQIKNNLRTLIGSATRGAQPLAPALKGPNSAYNQFVSTWNNGTGDLGRSFNRINEFWTLLQTAQPELDRLMVLGPSANPATRRPPGVSPEIQVLTRLRSESNDLFEVFKSCVKNNTPSAAQRIKEHVGVIAEQLNHSSLSPQARTALTNSKRDWQQFTICYSNGRRIDKTCLPMLEHFVIDTNNACAPFLGS